MQLSVTLNKYWSKNDELNSQFEDELPRQSILFIDNKLLQQNYEMKSQLKSCTLMTEESIVCNNSKTIQKY